MVRDCYRAKTVVANDPNFDESVFTVVFPPGYLIKDLIRNVSYKAATVELQ